MPPFVVPLFISHQGCPHRCLFCDQQAISGRSGELSAETVKVTIGSWLGRPRRDPAAPVQVAFYGGSFTGLPLARQRELLAACHSFLEAGTVQEIRLSTRPDYVGPETGSFLKQHGVGIVELGIQSMTPAVLLASHRGHSADDVQRAFGHLRKAGLRIGAQLMPGLPGETTSSLLASARQVAHLKPDFVRLYPTVVLEGSELDRLRRAGAYQPLSLNRAVALCGRLKKLFDLHSIKVVRMGLQPTEELARKVTAGPYHPAFGELVGARLFFLETRRHLAAAGPGGRARLAIAPADRSLFQGQRNNNLRRLDELGLLQRLELVIDPDQPRHCLTASPLSQYKRLKVIKRSVCGPVLTGANTKRNTCQGHTGVEASLLPAGRALGERDK